MDQGEALLEAIRREPADDLAWVALADWLEEAGLAERAELCRLTHRLRALPQRSAARPAVQTRAQEMVLAGVEPCMPQVVNGVGMRLTLIPPGTFRMGAARAEPGRAGGESPRHAVTISRPFYLGTFPVTQAEYEAVTGRNPAHFRAGGQGADKVRGMDTSRFPVERVSWADAVSFCERLSKRPGEKKAGRVYRLPTEAEWEYACRAGTTSTFHSGDSYTSGQANFDGNYPSDGATKGEFLARTCEVGRYRPNLWGLYDMTGNVWAWCADWYDAGTYTRSSRTDPAGPEAGTRRCRRGGSWYMNATQCRSAYRSSNTPGEAVEYCGMRVVMEVGVR